MLCVCMLIYAVILSVIRFFFSFTYSKPSDSSIRMHEFAEKRQPSTCFQSACGFLCIFVMFVHSSWSWKANDVHWVESDNGELLCGMSPPNKTLKAVVSRNLCLTSCFYVCSSPCQTVNYRENAKVCEYFYYIPCSFDVQQDCINYQVSTYIIIKMCN